MNSIALIKTPQLKRAPEVEPKQNNRSGEIRFSHQVLIDEVILMLPQWVV
jgi:hypothetical protein